LKEKHGIRYDDKNRSTDMTFSSAEKDRAFSDALDLDYSGVAFETMINEPDFWETANRWLATSNTNQESSVYQLNSKRVSKVISLLTAQPSNSACNQHYEQFVITAHDFLAQGARQLMNDAQHNKEAIKTLNLPTPEAPYLPPLAMQTTPEAWLKLLSDQVQSTNTWLLHEMDIAALASLADKGHFPLSLIENPYLYTDPATGNPVATLNNMRDQNQLILIFAVMQNPATLNQIFNKALEEQFPDQHLAWQETGMTGHETVAACVNNNLFKDSFDWDWRTLRAQAVEKIMAAIDLKNHQPEVEYSVIESPETEYRDPEIETSPVASDVDISL
jgi:hypothetical protein